MGVYEFNNDDGSPEPSEAAIGHRLEVGAG